MSGVQGNYAIPAVPVHSPDTDVQSLPAQGMQRASVKLGFESGHSVLGSLAFSHFMTDVSVEDAKIDR